MVQHLDPYAYLDYQEFLRDFYSAEKSRDPLFSYRVFAQAVGIDASLLVKILQGKRHLSREGIEQVIQFFRFDSKHSEYFRELVAYGKANRDVDLRKHFEALQNQRPAHSRRIESDLYRYFQHWYFPAIRSALDVFPYKGDPDAALLAKSFHPPLNASQVKEAISVLIRLGLACPDGQGFIRPATAHLSTGERWQSAAVRDYQKQLIQLAMDSIEGIPKEERDISSLTLALNSHELELIRAILAESRRSIVRQVDAMPATECNAVYQLNIQFFPVMQRKDAV